MLMGWQEQLLPLGGGNTDSLHKIFEKLVNDDKILYKLSKHAIESPTKFSIESQMESIIEVYSKIKK